MNSLGNSRIIFPLFDELIFTDNPKFSGSMSILSTTPPLIVYLISNVPLSPASTGNSLVVSVITVILMYTQIAVSAILFSPYTVLTV